MALNSAFHCKHQEVRKGLLSKVLRAPRSAASLHLAGGLYLFLSASTARKEEPFPRKETWLSPPLGQRPAEEAPGERCSCLSLISRGCLLAPGSLSPPEGCRPRAPGRGALPLAGRALCGSGAERGPSRGSPGPRRPHSPVRSAGGGTGRACGPGRSPPRRTQPGKSAAASPSRRRRRKRADEEEEKEAGGGRSAGGASCGAEPGRAERARGTPWARPAGTALTCGTAPRRARRWRGGHREDGPRRVQALGFEKHASRRGFVRLGAGGGIEGSRSPGKREASGLACWEDLVSREQAANRSQPGLVTRQPVPHRKGTTEDN